ncbi:hypothetical protein G7Y89_g3537 [Cudoniella acicularis]|uniref:Zn(2)-C6 fungal-type domain-containing protein n=1 Tax=Cudoniella acicularis TaxID=354080 RepID=A0A8H4RSD5_9HELO|nr:hypothetical protein G7Y89_g3537 [Cudoniella acicularis]
MTGPTLEEDSSQGKKPRASKPKVKTGCLTCKARRVKCDETKPECLRCSNFGRKCGGYPSREESPPPKKPTHLGPRRLLSKAMQVGPSRSPSPSPMPLPTPAVSTIHSSLPAGVTFQDEREYQYFCHFRDHTSIEFSAGFEPTLWNVLVLQACDNASIRQLATATAALNLAMGSSQNMGEFEKDSHHQYALQQYGEALKGIREMVASGQDSIRIALISALLIFCFESLHNELGRGIVHIQSAVEMIVKRISDAPQSFYFPRVKTLGIRESSRIEDDLLTAFMRLDQPTLTLLGRREDTLVVSNRIFNVLFSQEHLEIPRGFATIGEARVYLEDIRWRVLSTGQPRQLLPGFQATNQDSSNMGFSGLTLKLKEWYESSGILNASSDQSIELAHWHDAFSALLNHAMSPAGDFIFIPAVTLHIQALSTGLLADGYFSLSGSEAITEASSSRAESRFPTIHAVLRLARRMIDHPNFTKGFVFDIGTIPSLVSIVMLCPERQLRWEALDVLKSMRPRKEAVWDSAIAAEEGQRFLEDKDRAAGLDMIDPDLLGSR